MGYKGFGRRLLLEHDASPLWGSLPKSPWRRVAVYTKEVSRYHRDIKNIPSNVRGLVKRSNKA